MRSTSRTSTIASFLTLGARLGGAVLCAAVLFTCRAGSSGRPELPGGAEQCGTILWTPPETLRTSGGLAAFIEGSQVVATRDGALMIGTWGAEVDTLPRALTAGFRLERYDTARSVMLPVDRARWGPPRVAPLETGSVAVVWIPEDSSGASSLYAADLGPDGWGPVTRIDAGIPLQWSSVSASALIRSAGDLLMLVPATGLTAGPVLVRRAGSRWSATPLAIENLFYPRLAPLGRDTLLVAYVAGASPDGNTLFVRHVTAGGDSVGSRHRISTPGGGPVHYPDLALAGDSVIHLVWAIQGTTGVMSRLGHATSRDRGMSWRSWPDLVVPGGFDIVWSTLDDRGRLHIAARGERDDGPHPLHFLWTGSEWRTSSIPPAGTLTSAGHPVVVQAADGTWRAIWGAAGYDRPGLPAPVSMISRGRESCAADAAGAEIDHVSADRGRPAASTPRHLSQDERPLNPGHSVGLGTHPSVRGAASPRAAALHQQRGKHAIISDHQPRPDARRAGHRDARVRGPPGLAARARG